MNSTIELMPAPYQELARPPKQGLAFGWRLLIAAAVAVVLGGLAAGGGFFWMLMAAFASDGYHGGELPDSVAIVFLAEMIVVGLMVVIPPALILCGVRWPIALVGSITTVVLAIVASFALFIVYAVIMSGGA